MRLKKAKQEKNSTVATRCTIPEHNKIQQKANIYCDGNVSEYLLYAALNFVPGREDFEKEGWEDV